MRGARRPDLRAGATGGLVKRWGTRYGCGHEPGQVLTIGSDAASRRTGAGISDRRGASLFALAMFGAHLAYAPLLTLLLPRRIVAIAPQHAAAMASVVMLTGAVAASLAHIFAGWISDGWRRRHGNRRAPIALGLCLTVVALIGLGFARRVDLIIGGLIVFQVALNLMFAPAGALLVDYFPDRAKGRVAALSNLAMPLAGLGTGAAALLFPRDGWAPFVALAGAVMLAVLPLIAVWPFAAAAPVLPAKPVLPAPEEPLPPSVHDGAWRRDLWRAGLARLLVQGGAAFMMTYFYLFLVRHPGRVGLGPGQAVDGLYGRLVMATTLIVLIVTVAAGHWSDRNRRRRAPMMAGALAAALALGAVQGGSGALLMVGYGLFQVGLIAYLALDAALVAELLRGHARPGEMLGYMNLSNTLPSILVPLIVLGLTGGAADVLWAPGFAGAAGCCVLAAMLVARIRTVA
jgi:MFS family permease